MSNSKNKQQEHFSIQEDQPTDWFEPLYSNASQDGAGVSWANMGTHPAFAKWLVQNPLIGEGKSALVVGCGMGDDAIALEALGFEVTAFDVSKTAIKFCKERFPASKVRFLQADLLMDQPEWVGAFDFVLEIYTVQALPPKFEQELIERIASFVAPGGRLLVVAEVSKKPRTFESGPPWVLTPEHVDRFVSCGLSVESKDINSNEPAFGEGQYVTSFIK